MYWRAIGSLAAVLTMFGFVPQICKMFRTKSVSDVSGLTLIQFSVGVFLWMLYGLHLKDVIIIGANAVIFLSLIITLTLYFRYRDAEKMGRRRGPSCKW